MSRLGMRNPNTPLFFATPLLIVDPEAIGITNAEAVVTASVTDSSVYPRTFVYVYGIKDSSLRLRRGPATLILYGIEAGDIDLDHLELFGQAVALPEITAESNLVALHADGVAEATISAVAVDAPVFFFTTPTIRERRFLRRHGLWDRMYLHRGLTIIRYGTSYQQIDNPSTDQMDTADALFIGGRTYRIDEAEAALLTAAGYGHWINDTPDEPIDEIDFSQYGTGVYGTGPYGA